MYSVCMLLARNLQVTKGSERERNVGHLTHWTPEVRAHQGQCSPRLTKLPKSTEKQGAHLVPPYRQLTARLHTPTRGPSKLLHCKMPIRSCGPIGHIRTKTKSQWLSTRSFLAHAKLPVDQKHFRTCDPQAEAQRSGLL